MQLVTKTCGQHAQFKDYWGSYALKKVTYGFPLMSFTKVFRLKIDHLVRAGRRKNIRCITKTQGSFQNLSSALTLQGHMRFHHHLSPRPQMQPPHLVHRLFSKRRTPQLLFNSLSLNASYNTKPSAWIGAYCSYLSWELFIFMSNINLSVKLSGAQLHPTLHQLLHKIRSTAYWTSHCQDPLFWHKKKGT